MIHKHAYWIGFFGGIALIMAMALFLHLITYVWVNEKWPVPSNYYEEVIYGDSGPRRLHPWGVLGL